MSQEDSEKKSGREATQFKPWNKAASKYKQEYVEMLYEYFNRPAVTIEEHTEYNDRGQVVGVERLEIPAEYPTFEGFAAMIGVTSLTLRHWCEEHDRFNACYAWAREKQREILMVNGIFGRYNANFAKFIAMNCHGMHEKVVNEGSTTVSVQLAPEADEEAN